IKLIVCPNKLTFVQVMAGLRYAPIPRNLHNWEGWAFPENQVGQKMSTDFTFNIKSIRFDEDYRPSSNTRITTNFANLALGESRQENLRSTLRMIDNRFNAMAHWDNPNGDRYALELDIIS